MVGSRYPQLFTGHHLIETRGIGRIFNGLPPTDAELDDAVVDLSIAMDKAELEEVFEFEQFAGLLLERLRSGANLGQITDSQRQAGRFLDTLVRQGKWGSVLGQTGWPQRETRQFAPSSAITAAVQKALDQADARTAFELEKLAAYTAIPSISDPTSLPNPKVMEASEWVVEELKREGFKATVLTEKGANPIVYAERVVDPAKPTVLFYSHMDVQPVGEGWETNPFRAFVRNGRLYGRGSADDKAGFQSALAAVRAYRLGGVELPVNVAFLVEGEEEIGSPNLEKLLAKLPSGRLNPNLVLLVDSENAKPGVPTITVGLRGLVQFQVDVRTAHQGSHPGLKGYVTEALTASDILVSRLVDHTTGELRIPGLTDRPRSRPERVLESLKALGSEEEMTVLLRESGWMLEGVAVLGDPSLPVAARAGLDFALKQIAVRPPQSFERPAGMNVPFASKKLQVRLPPGVDAEEAAPIIKAYVESLRPFGAHVSVKILHKAQPWFGDLDSPSLRLLSSAFSCGYGVPAVWQPVGGSIPFITAFERMIGDAGRVWPVPVEDPYTSAHAANESLNITDFASTVRSFIYLLDLMGRGEQG